MRQKNPKDDGTSQAILHSSVRVLFPSPHAIHFRWVRVEALHPFTKAEKRLLYRKLVTALKSGGVFILTDYFAPTEEYVVQTLREAGFYAVEILNRWGATLH